MTVTDAPATEHDATPEREVLTGGRYIDRYVKRDGKWLILSRTFVADWSHSHPSTMERDGFYEALTNRGCFGTTDPVYAHWAA